MPANREDFNGALVLTVTEQDGDEVSDILEIVLELVHLASGVRRRYGPATQSNWIGSQAVDLLLNYVLDLDRQGRQVFSR